MKRVNLLKRERINHMLCTIYDYYITIVEAPMGFGKTTAVKTFLQDEKKPCLWITFLNSKDSCKFFWNEFSKKIGKLDENTGSILKKLGFPVDAPQILKVLSLLENIDIKEKIVMVIDDYHLSENPSLNRLIEQIALTEMDNFHMIIITRNIANLRFLELISKGSCQLISEQQLRFTDKELREYCLMMNNKIQEEDLIKIIEYTQGWISLTYMVLLALEQGIPVGMNSNIDDLIENSLFNTYDESIQNFLLKLSVMDSFTAEQAIFVTKQHESVKILRKLRRQNAFLYYEETEKVYKIHNVLLDFLRIKLKYEKEQLKELYARLGQWYLNNGELQIAYGYLYQAGDTERIVTELNNPANVKNELAEFDGYLEMFSTVSEEVFQKYPIAYLQFIFIAILKGNEETVEECSRKLDRLQRFYESLDNIEESYKNHIIAEILIIKKFTAFNDLEKMYVNNDRILKLLNGKQSYIMLSENEFTFGSPHLLYAYFRKEGSLRKILHIAMENMPIHSKIAKGSGAGCEYLMLAEYSLETGDFETAEINSLKAIYKARTKEQTSIIICAYFNLMRLYLLQGKIKEAIEKLNELQKYVESINNPIYNTTIDLCKGYICACLKQPERIPYWLQAGDMNGGDFFYEGMAFNYIVYGKAVMLSKNYIKLEMLTESFEEKFSTFSNELGFLHNRIFKAVAKYQLYGLEKGVEELKKALNKARRDHIIMPFIENASYIMYMLETIKSQCHEDEYINSLIKYSEQYNEALTKNYLVQVKLSQREIEVLALAAKSLRRNEIAVCLRMSENTVKTHFHNIYQKLGVSGKLEAIRMGRMYKII